MSEHSITVSDGEAFYSIPVSDLEEACADGFYLPLIHNLTIVSDGEELFEVPITDLAEAEADGFEDILGSEQSLVYQLRDEGHVATQIDLYVDDEAIDEEDAEPFANGEGHAGWDDEATINTSTDYASSISNSSPDVDEEAETTIAGIATADPHSIFEDDDDLEFEPEDETIDSADDTVDGGAAAAAVGDAAVFGVADSLDPVSLEPGVAIEIETEDEEPEELPLYKKILGIGPAGGRTWGVLSLNTALHAVALLLLALIILPSDAKEEFMTIASTVVAAESPKELDVQAMDIEQPVEEVEDIPTADTAVDSMVDSLDPIDVDLSDAAVAAPAEAPAPAPGAPAAKLTGEMGGRSKAGRSQLVAKMGGTVASEKAVNEGLNWMARHQLKDGGWSYNHVAGQKSCDCTSPGSLVSDCRNAATGMAILAMLGAGNTPFDGNFPKEVDRGVQFLIRNAKPTPAGVDFRGQHANNTGMYTHAIATTAMCEVLTMIESEFKRDMPDKSKRPLNIRRQQAAVQLRPICQAAVNFICNAQFKKDGGWGYNPQTAGDTSILGWQVMALKSAKHAHVPFPAGTMVAANRFLNKVQDKDGQYGYRDITRKKPSTTAIGIVCRMLSGMSRSNPLMQRGVGYISAVGPDKGNMYYNYYATQVMLNWGGETWTKWNDVMRDQLVNSQIQSGHAAGSWDVADPHAEKAGRLYMTALCVMTLEVYYRHLPLYGNQNYGEEKVAEADPKKKTSRDKKKDRAAERAMEKKAAAEKRMAEKSGGTSDATMAAGEKAEMKNAKPAQ